MTDFHDLYSRKLTKPAEALRGLQRRCTILLGFFAAQPPALVEALAGLAAAGTFDELNVFYCNSAEVIRS